MMQSYEQPAVTVTYFVPAERLAKGDDGDRARSNIDLPDDDFNPSLEDSIFG